MFEDSDLTQRVLNGADAVIKATMEGMYDIT